jgi:hypothetical protein
VESNFVILFCTNHRQTCEFGTKSNIKANRYNEYVKDMFYYGDYGEIPKSIKYMNNGKVSFILKEKLGENGESLLKYKKISSLIY